METDLKNSIFASDRVLKNSFSQFLEFKQEFCLGLFRNVSWYLYLPEYIIIASMTTLILLSLQTDVQSGPTNVPLYLDDLTR